MSPTPLVWSIPGCSSDIGRELTVPVLQRGNVIAITRAQSFDSIRDLRNQGAHIMELDASASLDTLKELAAEAIRVYGRVDIVMNNAKFGGAYRSISYDDIYPYKLNVSRAFLSYMRERKTGTISFIGSCYGWRNPPFSGIYVTSKFAV
ncbi:hypothetical protein CVT25_005344 [Psilocybe cyanescens]|uniref:Ketoreductase (KR) domain-containing protein n=1 Tax=Psilocybe cyanescens TaxID=93625 RepID=A0A409WWT7_PSICY|nr:hypothetical protein CVT25_005344 [Psilocybe cyanescens]